jgi:hypothetical protein
MITNILCDRAIAQIQNWLYADVPEAYKGLRERTDCPVNGPVISRIVRETDSIVFIYSDGTYMRVQKIRP